MQIALQILSCFKISNNRLLAWQCSNAVKRLINPIILTEYSLFPKKKCIFNVHQITTSGGKFNIFLIRTLTKSTAENAPTHAHGPSRTPASQRVTLYCTWALTTRPQGLVPRYYLKWKNHLFFLQNGHSLSPSSVEKGTSPHTPLFAPTNLSGSTLRPPKFQPDLRNWHRNLRSTRELRCMTYYCSSAEVDSLYGGNMYTKLSAAIMHWYI